VKVECFVSHIRIILIVRIILPLTAVLLLGAMPAQSAITNFESNAWDNDVPHIYRNGQPVTSSAQASMQIQLNDIPYFSTEEVFENQAIAYNSAGAGNPDTLNKQINQHLYAYTLPGNAEPFYYLDNTTGHTVTYLLTEEDLIQMGFEPRKSVSVRSHVILDGSLSLARSSLG